MTQERSIDNLEVEENEKLLLNSNNLLILSVKYFYNWLRFKVYIDKSCRGHFFPDSVDV